MPLQNFRTQTNITSHWMNDGYKKSLWVSDPHLGANNMNNSLLTQLHTLMAWGKMMVPLAEPMLFDLQLPLLACEWLCLIWFLSVDVQPCPLSSAFCLKLRPSNCDLDSSVSSKWFLIEEFQPQEYRNTRRNFRSVGNRSLPFHIKKL